MPIHLSNILMNSSKEPMMKIMFLCWIIPHVATRLHKDKPSCKHNAPPEDKYPRITYAPRRQYIFFFDEIMFLLILMSLLLYYVTKVKHESPKLNSGEMRVWVMKPFTKTILYRSILKMLTILKIYTFNFMAQIN